MNTQARPTLVHVPHELLDVPAAPLRIAATPARAGTALASADVEVVYVPPAPGDALAGLLEGLAREAQDCSEEVPFPLERRRPAKVRVCGVELPASSRVRGGW